jgi:dihydroorotase
VTEIVLRRPFDAHAHLRDGDLLRAVRPATASWCGAVIAMPNLRPPVRTPAEARSYAARIDAAGSPGLTALTPGYLTDASDPVEVVAGFRGGAWPAMKLYPAHATTHAEHGVRSMDAVAGVLSAMDEAGMPLLVHGEGTDPDVDVFDREAVFVDRVLDPVRRRHPNLPIVLEHVSSAAGLAWVRDAGGRTAGTITPHHLVWTRNDLFRAGLRPHCWCLPVVKTAADRDALRVAATSGDPRFFLGTDSAPHPVADKERDGGAAGVFNAPTALQTYAEVFEEHRALHHLDAFASQAGRAFYGLPAEERTIRLVREEQVAAPMWGGVRVFRGGETLRWRVDPD